MFKWLVAIDFYQQLFGYQHSSKYILLCPAEEKKSIQVWSILHNFHFRVSYSFKEEVFNIDYKTV